MTAKQTIAIGLALGLAISIILILLVSQGQLFKATTPTRVASASGTPEATLEPDVALPSVTPTKTATPTNTLPAGARQFRSITLAVETPGREGLAANAKTPILPTETPVKTATPKPSPKPGEPTEAPTAKPLGEVTNPLTGEQITIPGYQPMPTVNVQLPVIGGATPTLTPTPCKNFMGVGCPPDTKKPATPAAPADGEKSEEGGGLNLFCLGGLVVLGLIVLAGIWFARNYTQNP